MVRILRTALVLLIVAGTLAGAYAIATTLRSPVTYAEQARERADASAFRPTIGRVETEDEAKEIADRDRWFYGQRAFPEKHVEHAKMRRAQSQARQVGRDIAAADGSEPAPPRTRAAPTAALAWSSLGPRPIDDGNFSPYNGNAPWSGRVTSIAHHPTLRDTAYVGGAAGGVWKTTDGGVTWTPIFDSQPSLAIGAIAVDPGNADTLYVGTGESNFGADSYFGAGIFKSTNGGSSWSKLGQTLFDNCHVADVVKPGASATVFAAVHPYGRGGATCAAGIYRSDDGGLNWEVVRNGGTPTDLAFKPGTPSTIYAAYYYDGVYRSTANGDAGSWSRSSLDLADAGRIALSTTKANPSRVYAAVMNAGQAAYGSTLGTYASRDSGGTWTQLPAEQNYCGYPGDSGGQCSYDLAIAADPVTQGSVYAAGIRLMRHNGTAWSTLGYGADVSDAIHVDIHALSFDAANRLWIGSDGGVWRKASGTSTTFTNLNRGLSLTQFTQGTSGSVAGRFVGGTQDNGTMLRTASTGKWFEFAPGDGGHSAIDPANENVIYSSYIRGTVSKSTDGGGNNPCIFTTLAYYAPYCTASTTDAAKFYAPMEMDPSNAQKLYVGTTRVWRTTTGGTGWTPVSPHFAGPITAIGTSKTRTDTVYAAWQSDTATGIKKTITGTTWTDTAALPNRVITHIEVDPTNSSVAYAGLSGFGGGHVYRTTNGGTSWVNVSGNLPDSPVNAIALDRRTTPTTLYAATDVGVFWSIDGGAAWANASQGLPNTVVSDVRVDTRANRIVAATYGRGVYSVPIASPQVKSFTPASGATGTSVTITGVNFTRVKSVKFGSTPATYTVTSPTQIVARVPDGAATGRISVATGAGTAVSTTNYTVTASITSFSPASGPAGTYVVINGTGLTGVTQVRFNGEPAQYQVYSPNRLDAKVPVTATTGRITVTTSSGSVVTSRASFTKT